MKWYIWVIIAVVLVVALYFIFGDKKNETSVGSQGDPITNAGSGVSNQNPSAFDWFAGVIAPTIAAGLAIVPSLINQGGDGKDEEQPV